MTNWNTFLQWLATAPLASWLRTFLTVLLGAVLADWAQLGSFDFTNYKVWLMTSVLSLIPMIVRWLNSADPAFGRVLPTKKTVKK